MNRTRNLLWNIQNWARETFPHQTRESVLAHLEEELTELRAALERRTQKGNAETHGAVGDEIADCIILLVALAEVEGLDAYACVEVKHRVNTSRTFAFDPDKGYHKRTGT